MAGRRRRRPHPRLLHGRHLRRHARAPRPEGLRTVALTAPVEFSEAGTYLVWTQRRHLDAEEVARALGNVPGSLIDLKMLRPVPNFVGAYATMWERLLAGRT